MSEEIDVLRTRTAIHVLYPPELLEMHDTIDSVLGFWFRGGLSESKLSAVLANDYGLTIKSSVSPAALGE